MRIILRGQRRGVTGQEGGHIGLRAVCQHADVSTGCNVRDIDRQELGLGRGGSQLGEARIRGNCNNDFQSRIESLRCQGIEDLKTISRLLGQIIHCFLVQVGGVRIEIGRQDQHSQWGTCCGCHNGRRYGSVCCHGSGCGGRLGPISTGSHQKQDQNKREDGSKTHKLSPERGFLPLCKLYTPCP